MVYNCSTPKIISYIHLGLGWIDYFEINEAFSVKKKKNHVSSLWLHSEALMKKCLYVCLPCEIVNEKMK